MSNEIIDLKILFNEHKCLVDKLQTQYERKQSVYKDSFGKTYRDMEEFGILTAFSRITDKYNRIGTLTKAALRNEQVDVNNESMKDSLMDMADYCLMTIMELNRHDIQNSKNINETNVSIPAINEPVTVQSKPEVQDNASVEKVSTQIVNEIIEDMKKSEQEKRKELQFTDMRKPVSIPRREQVEASRNLYNK